MKIFLITIVFASICFLAKGQQSDNVDYNKLFTPVNQNARYPGGNSAFLKFFFKNYKSPKTTENAFGKIIVELTIEKDGSLSNVKCEKPSCPEFDAETRRIMQSSPKWIPGKNHNKLVRVSYVIPIGIEPQFEDQ